jgi:hypothetical protein
MHADVCDMGCAHAAVGRLHARAGRPAWRGMQMHGEHRAHLHAVRMPLTAEGWSVGCCLWVRLQLQAHMNRPTTDWIPQPTATSYIYLLHVNVYLLAVTRDNVNAASVMVRAAGGT